MIAKLIPYILIYSFIAFQVFNLMYCYKASLPYELIHPISQLLLPLTPQFVLIKLIQSNSLTWVTSFIKKRNNWFIALYMQEQHPLLPLLQNKTDFVNSRIQYYNVYIASLTSEMHHSTFATTSPGTLLSTTVSLTNLGIQRAWKLLALINKTRILIYKFEPRMKYLSNLSRDDCNT